MTKIMNIPFCRTTLDEEEKAAIGKVIDSGWVVMGKITRELEEKFAEYVGAKYAVFVDSCTSALFLSLKAIGVNHETRVAVPSLTFVSTAEVIVNAGAIPYFVDVSREDFCMDKDYEPEFQLSIPVHLTGNKAKAHGCIYDSAHRIARNDVKDSSSLWCYSFYATKNMTCVQGGMIALNDFDMYQWLSKARDHGTSKGTTERYKEGKWKYSIDFVGYREKSDDVHATICLVQLNKLEKMNAERERIITRYNERLGLKRTGNHLYPILVDDRNKFIPYMAERGVQVSVHFLPLHTMPAFEKYPIGWLGNTNYLGDHMVSLPLFPQLTDKEVDYICDIVENSKQFIYE